MKKSNEFIFVKCSDKKTAQAVKAASPPEVVVFDCDAELVHRRTVSDAAAIVEVLDAALKKYSNSEITWNVYEDKALADAKEKNKLVVLLFTDDKKDSQDTAKALEDRVLAKHHEKLVFIKVPYTQGAEDAKKWGVNQAPSILLVDPAKEAGTKSVVDKLGGKQKPLAIKAMLVKGMEKVKREGR